MLPVEFQRLSFTGHVLGINGGVPYSMGSLPVETQDRDARIHLPSPSLNFAVIGAGPIGRLHAQGLESSRQARVAAVVDPEFSRAQNVARQYGALACVSLQKALAQVSLAAVTIATPDNLHVDLTLEALNSGLHVFCEKPLATSVSEAARMVARALQVERQLAVDYNRRYGFAYGRAKQICDSGAIGDVNIVSIQVVDRPPSTPSSRPATFMLTSLLTHHFDLLRWFAGEVESVSAQFGTTEGDSLIRNLTMQLQFRSGALANLSSSYREGQSRTWERMEISGARGQVTVDDVAREVVVRSLDADHCQSYRPDPFRSGDQFYATIVDHVRDFVMHLIEGRPVPVSGTDGLRGLEIVAATVQSAAQRGFTRVLTAEEICQPGE